jgi:hypothetical protein
VVVKHNLAVSAKLCQKSHIVGWMGMMDVDLKPFANVTGWLQRCYERPAIAKLMAG